MKSGREATNERPLSTTALSKPRPRFRLGCAGAAGKVQRDVHQPLHRHDWPGPGRVIGARPAAPAGPRLAPDLVRLAPADACAGQDFEVVAADQRGVGLSDKPEDGYDTGTLANDLVALMDALGHQRFAVVGCDTGMAIAYALAADHPEQVERLASARRPCPASLRRTRWFSRPRSTTGSGTSRSTSSQRDQRAARHGPRRDLLRCGVLPLRRDEEAARGDRRLLRRRLASDRRPCTAPSRSTVRSRLRLRRTKSARRGV